MKNKGAREVAKCYVMVWGRFCLKILFPFPLVVGKLIGDYFYNRQYVANCLVRFSFLNYCLRWPEQISQNDRTYWTTGKLQWPEWPEIRNDRKKLEQMNDQCANILTERWTTHNGDADQILNVNEDTVLNLQILLLHGHMGLHDSIHPLFKHRIGAHKN
jgi:hypothetical protein